MRPNTEMKVPGTKVHRQVAVEITQLGGLLKAHLKDGALDTWTNNNTLPVMLKQVFNQSLHSLVCRLKVTQDRLCAIELCNRLLPQQFGLGRCGHKLLLRGEWSLVIEGGGRSQPGTVWHSSTPAIMMHERLQRETCAPAFLLEFRLW